MSPVRMLRHASVRIVARPRHARPFSTSDPKNQPPRATSHWAVVGGFVVATSIGVIYSTAQRRQTTKAQLAVQGFPAIDHVEDIPVTSPVPVLDLKAANAKIREEARTFVFDGSDGAQGRVDVARLSSNYPVEDDWSVAVGKGVGGAEKTLYAGVYDGHAGWATSTVLRQALIPYVSSTLSKLPQSSNAEAIDAAIKRAFTQLDDRITNTAQDAIQKYPQGSAEGIAALAPAIAGSCALLSIYDPAISVLRTAVTGDSRAVLGSWSRESKSHAAHPLSEDQTGFNKAEVDRLSVEHPGETEKIISRNDGRLLGMAVTRAFGDHRWKWPLELIEKAHGDFFASRPRPSYKTPPYMTARPEITTKEVRGEDFAILATDGLWDQISSEDAVACVSGWLAARKSPPEPVAPSTVAGEGSGPNLVVDKEDWVSWRATPKDFTFEDLDSAAVCLVKNACGGRRSELFRGVVTAREPASRYVRDDITVMVVFFRDPYQETK